MIYAESLYAKKDDKRALAAYLAAGAVGADPAGFAPNSSSCACDRDCTRPADSIGRRVPGFPADLLALGPRRSFLALSKYAETDAEASKCRASPHYPRHASLEPSAREVEQLKDAIATAGGRRGRAQGPPAPPAAYLALAECLLEGGRPATSRGAGRRGESAAALSEPDKVKLRAKIAFLRIRGAAADSRS